MGVDENMTPVTDQEKAVVDHEKARSDTTPVEGGAQSVPIVDEATEKRLIKKLDRRIIPICCWIYLMNFMDRGM